MRKVFLPVYLLWVLGNPLYVLANFFGSLSLTIVPSATISQQAEATWSWNGGTVQNPPALVLVVSQQGKSATSVTASGVQARQGTIPFSIEQTGSFQASLFWEAFFDPHFAIQTTDLIGVTSPPPPTLTPTPATSLPTPPSASNAPSIGSTPQPGSSFPPVSPPGSTSTSLNPNPTISVSTDLSITTEVNSATATDQGNSDTSSATPTENYSSPSATIPPTIPPTGVLVGIILGSLAGFILLASLAFWLWRQRRIRREMDRMQATFFPGLMMAGPSNYPSKVDWDDVSSLAPSDSVSRAVHGLHEKVRPLVPSTVMAALSEDYRE